MALPDIAARARRAPETLGRDDAAALLLGWTSLPGAIQHEMLLRGGFDGLLVDMQHGLSTLHDAGETILCARLLDRFALVRVGVGDLVSAARVLDFGAQGVVMPMIETVAEAEAFARAVKYPPLGLRSYGPARAAQMHAMTGADYFAAANEGVLALAMIETRGALEALDGILAVPGLDGVLVGPSDLSLALGSDQPDPTGARTEEAVAEIARRCAQAGRIAAIYALATGDARRYRRFGYGIVGMLSDTRILLDGAAEACRQVRS